MDARHRHQYLPLEPTDLRLWAVMAALRRGIAPKAIHDKTNIDMWFLDKMVNIINMEKRLLSQPLTRISCVRPKSAVSPMK